MVYSLRPCLTGWIWKVSNYYLKLDFQYFCMISNVFSHVAYSWQESLCHADSYMDEQLCPLTSLQTGPPCGRNRLLIVLLGYAPEPRHTNTWLLVIKVNLFCFIKTRARNNLSFSSQIHFSRASKVLWEEKTDRRMMQWSLQITGPAFFFYRPGKPPSVILCFRGSAEGYWEILLVAGMVCLSSQFNLRATFCH